MASFYAQEKVTGNVVITVRGAPLSHEGVILTAEGSASLQLSAKSVGLFEAFYSTIKPTQLFLHTTELQSAGKLPDGRHNLSFEFEVSPVESEKLLESYHGVYINIQVDANLISGALPACPMPGRSRCGMSPGLLVSPRLLDSCSGHSEWV